MSAQSGSPSSLVIHCVIVAGVRTSVRLEPVMWDALRDVAAQEGTTLHALVTRISQQNLASGLTSAIRVYIVKYYRSRLMQELRRSRKNSNRGPSPVISDENIGGNRAEVAHTD